MLTRFLVLLALFGAVLPVPGVCAGEPVILVVGDSLSAAYGIPVERGWVNLMDQRIRTQGHKYRVVNASISGETSQGGLHRFPDLLERHSPAIVIVALGANDGLRGYPLTILARNLAQMADLTVAAGAAFVLVGIQIPVNYGAAYASEFSRIYAGLGVREDVTLVPFLLEGFAEDLGAFQADGVHPTAEVQPVMLDNVWRVLAPLLDDGTDQAPGASPDPPVISSESG